MNRTSSISRRGSAGLATLALDAAVDGGAVQPHGDAGLAGLRQLLRRALRLRRVRWMIFALSLPLTMVAVHAVSTYAGVVLRPDGWSLLTLAAVLMTAMVCEFVDSSLGMGYGTTLTPLLLLCGFAPLDVVPAVLCSELVTGLLAAAMHQRDGNVDFRRDRQARSSAIYLSLLSAAGAAAAASLAVRISTQWLSALIGLIVLAAGVTTLATRGRQLQYRRSHIIAVGAVAAFNKGLSGGGYGPLVTAGQVVSGLPAKQAVGITSLAESWTCLVGLIAYLWLGRSFNSMLTPALTAGAVLSVPLATWTVRRMSERRMRGLVGGATIVLGLAALAKVLGVAGLSKISI